MSRLAVCLILALGACARPPALESTVTDADAGAPYPRLLPLDEVLAGLPAPDGAAEAPDLSGRIAALRARASGLRGAVVAGGARARMDGGVDTSTLR